MENKFKVLFGVFLGLAVVTAIIVGMLPFLLESSLSSQGVSNVKLDLNNSEGKVPGELKQQLKHTFTLFDYSTVKDKNVSLSNTSITFDEKVLFTELKYDDKSDEITGKATKEYTIANKTSDEKIKLPSLGLFETLETLSNPELYQQGIIGAVYLQKLFQSSDDFILRLFPFYAKINHFKDEKTAKEDFLKDLSKEVQDKAWGDDNYGLNQKKEYINGRN